MSRKGLFTQQKQLMENITLHPQQQTNATQSSSASKKSRHSPPASRSPTELCHTHLDGLESLSSILNNSEKWSQFKSWLREQSEGEDDDGVPITCERYAVFIECYNELDREYKKDKHGENVMKSFMKIANHKEKFLGNYRCLKCIDSAIRKQTTTGIKNVKNGTIAPSPDVYQLVHMKVFDKLSEMLGSYQNLALH